MATLTERFDAYVAGNTAITGYTNTNDPTLTGYGAAVSATQSVSAPNSLKVSGWTSGSPNMCFYPSTWPYPNQSSTVTFYIDSFSAQFVNPYVFVRGSNLSNIGGAGTGMFLKFSMTSGGGGGVVIQRRTNGSNSTLTGVTIPKTNFAVATWYTAKLKVVGQLYTATVQRVSDGFWLKNDGTFQAGAINAFNFTDSGGSIIASGVPGVSTNQTFATNVYYDDFIAGDETIPLVAPVLLNEGVSSTGVSFSWSVATNGVPGYTYQIQRNVNSAGWLDLGGSTSTLYYSDFAVSVSSPIQYRIVATDSVGATATSNTISVTTDPNGTNNVLRIVPSASVKQTVARVVACSTGPDTLTLAYSTSSSLTSPTTLTGIQVDLSTGHACAFDLTGLTPNTRYYYDVLTSGVGKLGPTYPYFTTFPAVGGQVLKLGFSSCMRGVSISDGTLAQLPTMHAFLNLGDLVYADQDQALTDEGVETASARYFRQLGRISLSGSSSSTSSWAALRKKTPVFTMMDDHDTGTNNYAGGVGAFYASGLQMFRELTGGANPNPYTPGTIYYTIDLVDVGIFVCDMRTYRSSESLTDNASKTMLGAQQLADLQAWLLANNSAYKIKIIAFPVSASGYSSTAGDSMGGNYDGFQVPTGTNGYRTERNALWQWIDTNAITGVMAISGDQHWSAAFKTAYNGRNRYEFQASPIDVATLSPPGGITISLTNGPVFFTYVGLSSGLLTIDMSLADPSVTYQVYGQFASLGANYTVTVRKSQLDAGLVTGGNINGSGGSTDNIIGIGVMI